MHLYAGLRQNIIQRLVCILCNRDFRVERTRLIETHVESHGCFCLPSLISLDLIRQPSLLLQVLSFLLYFGCLLFIDSLLFLQFEFKGFNLAQEASMLFFLENSARIRACGWLRHVDPWLTCSEAVFSHSGWACRLWLIRIIYNILARNHHSRMIGLNGLVGEDAVC